MVVSLQDAIPPDPELGWGLHPASALAFWDHHLPTAGVVDIALQGDLPTEVSLGNHGRRGPSTDSEEKALLQGVEGEFKEVDFRPLEGSMSVVSYNITEWGPAVEALLEHTLAGVLMFCETHIDNGGPVFGHTEEAGQCGVGFLVLPSQGDAEMGVDATVEGVP